MNPLRLYQPFTPPRSACEPRIELATLFTRRTLPFACTTDCRPMFLFVYGTLRRRAAHPMHTPLQAASRFVGDARVRGSLYMVGDYPALELGNAAGWVQGEVYELHDLAV
ncbi:MAG: gamma-glutamylcyclotransferase, partial [Deltaproteobacteria bacterium]|nr:gamma-glutamylcyclotransferase [Deltaproteobacteria bacterium]